MGGVKHLDIAAHFDLESRGSHPLEVIFHPTFNELRGVIRRLHTMLDSSEQQRRVFKEQLPVLFRRATNFRDSLVRAKLPTIQTEVLNGCFKCRKSHCQVSSFASEGSRFSCNVSGKEYSISSSFI